MRAKWLVLPIIAALCTAAVAAPTKKARRQSRNPLVAQVQMQQEAYDQQIIEWRAGLERYTGIRVKTDAKAKGVEGQQQKLIADAIARADIVPPERFQRFSWVQDSQSTKITGWHAEIVEAAPADGGLLVKLKVGPLNAANASLTILDYSLETYLISDAGVRHLQTTFPPTPGFATFN